MAANEPISNEVAAAVGVIVFIESLRKAREKKQREKGSFCARINQNSKPRGQAVLGKKFQIKKENNYKDSFSCAMSGCHGYGIG
jgi:hypothetical protein